MVKALHWVIRWCQIPQDGEGLTLNSETSTRPTHRLAWSCSGRIEGIVTTLVSVHTYYRKAKSKWGICNFLKRGSKYVAIVTSAMWKGPTSLEGILSSQAFRRSLATFENPPSLNVVSVGEQLCQWLQLYMLCISMYESLYWRNSSSSRPFRNNFLCWIS